jgi:protease secretion system membrane fusion protein
MKALQTKANATDVVSHDVTPITVNTDARVYTKLGWLITLIGVGGFILWAALAPLDKGVPLSGTVVSEGNHKTVQHMAGGTVEDILVKEGDHVKAGQVVIRMNAVTARSAYDITRVQLYTMRAAEARLIAERDGSAGLKFPKELLDHKSKDARLAIAMDGQSTLFMARRMALQNELSAADESVIGLKMQIKGLEESRESKKLQMSILKEQVDNTRELAKEGYVPRVRLMELERNYSQVVGSMAEDTGNIGRARQQVVEMARRRDMRVQEYQKEVRAQLADTQREVDSYVSRITAQELELNNTDVKAPVDGIVSNMSVFTRGGVVGSGFRLMDISPVNDGMVVEGNLPVNLVDKVHPGLKVELIMSAFNTNTTPHIAGVLTQVAPDRFVDERTGMPFYKVKAKVSAEGMKAIASKKLQVRPGMPVDMFIKTGERTMMSYLLKPVFDRAKTSMTEE